MSWYAEGVVCPVCSGVVYALVDDTGLESIDCADEHVHITEKPVLSTGLTELTTV